MVRIIPTVSEIVNRNISGNDFTKCHEVLTKNEEKGKKSRTCHKLGYFLTMRMMTAVLMSSCLMALSVTTTNLTGSLVCMVAEQHGSTADAR